MKPFTHRQPRKCRPVGWGRLLQMNGTVVAYRLFRRGECGKVHMAERQYLIGVAQRPMIAGDLIETRRRLRDRVKALAPAAMKEAA